MKKALIILSALSLLASTDLLSFKNLTGLNSETILKNKITNHPKGQKKEEK